jgi:saccharopine dehydrogenase-like NADP-dependent oxidoreductase
MKVIVLGAGLVGGPMAMDLNNDPQFEVCLVDFEQNKLNKYKESGIRLITADISDKDNLKKLIKGFDLVLSAVPGYMGFETLKTIIESDKNVIDIAFCPENIFDLEELAKEHGIIAICDIGVAPGMSNVLLAHAVKQLDKAESAKIFVGGLPKVKTWPWEYKAVFSPIDVIEEYIRPARYVENGKLVVKEALTDPELLEFDKVGTLEAFNSDGLRTLIDTIDCPNMIEKTMRYPGHIDKIRVMKSSGFFDTEEVEINNVKIRPIDFTTKILFPNWKLEEGEHDLTVMKVIVEGEKDGKKLRYEYDLYDEYDVESNVHSMARTTAYTATMAARMLVAGLYKRKGISAPEFIGEDPACVDFMLKGLKERKINYKEKITTL